MPRTFIAIAAGVLVTLLLAFEAADAVELPARDLALRLLPERDAAATAVVSIDEASLGAIGPWPWPRARLASLVDACARAGARAVILDVLLSDARADDERLAAAMHSVPTAAVAVLIENEQWLVPAPRIREATTVAHGNFELDRDGILRRFASTKQSGDRSYTALSLVAASFVRPTTVPIGQTIAPAFRTPPRAIPNVSAASLLRGEAGDALRGRLVFVGPTALGLGDRVLTPVSSRLAADPGVTVHAATTESLLRGETVRTLAPIASGALAALGVLAILHLRRLVGALAVVAAMLGGGALLLATTGLAIPFVSLPLVLLLTTAAVQTRFLTTSLRQSRLALSDQREQDLASKRLLAHELKTPLASMRNLTQLLAEFDLSDAERQRVTVLLRSEAGKLETMVQALLDLERLPLRDFASSSAVTDLGRLVDARLALLRAGAGRPLAASIAPDVLVRADGMLIERVIDNLVGNALKYTPPGTPLAITLREHGRDALLEVEDRGPGIADAERERIFQRFFRGSTARGTEGLGLGLPFVAEVARWHGGSVAVERPAKGGARFRFALPLAEGGA